MVSSILKSTLIVSGSSILKSIVRLYIEEPETIRIDFRIEEPKTIRIDFRIEEPKTIRIGTYYHLFMRKLLLRVLLKCVGNVFG